MAAMHLSFEEGVLEHWGAHVREAEGVRALELSFDSETKTLSLGKELAAEDTLEHDFERVVDCLSPSSASIWLVNLRQGKWILITYLSESLPPADKLVVASSVRGLITALGVSSIEAHYHASDPEELRWESFYDFLMRRTLPDGAEDNGDALRRQIVRFLHPPLSQYQQTETIRSPDCVAESPHCGSGCDCICRQWRWRRRICEVLCCSGR